MTDPRPSWLAPDAPADPKPVHWRMRRMHEAGATPAVARDLVAAGYTTLGHVADALASPEGMPKIKGVGPGTLAKLAKAVEAWQVGAE